MPTKQQSRKGAKGGLSARRCDTKNGRRGGRRALIAVTPSTDNAGTKWLFHPAADGKMPTKSRLRSGACIARNVRL